MSDRFNIFAAIVAMFLLIPAGCEQDASSSDAKARVSDMRTLAKKGDRPSIDALIDGLEDDSELVRRQAHRDLSNVLKLKIYFDPSASSEERASAISRFRSKWQNLKDRDLVEAVKKRMPLMYFYDLNTNELFEDLGDLGPIETLSGSYQGMPAGVCAVVLACRDCGDEADYYVGWLEVPANVLSEYGIAFETGGGRREEGQIAIRRPDGGEWAEIGTPEADAIVDASNHCDQRQALFCRPGR